MQKETIPCDSTESTKVGVHGFEPDAKTSEKTRNRESCGAESGALGAREAPLDANLQTVVNAWPALSDRVKAAIVAMVAQ